MPGEGPRPRRYETANGLALDVQRYLADEPVLAGPPSAGYRLRKFVRRHRGPVVAAGLIAACLVGGIVGTSAGLAWAVRERNAKAEVLVAETEAKEFRNPAAPGTRTAARRRDPTALRGRTASPRQSAVRPAGDDQ